MSRTVELQRASTRARRLYPRSKPFRGAYMKGVRAKLAGRSPESCPYAPDPRKTWRAVFRRAWLLGFQSVTRPE